MKNNIKKERIIVVFVFCFVLILVGGIIFLNSIFVDSKDIVEKYGKSMKDYDAEKMVEIFHENMILESYDSKDEMVEYFENNFAEMKKGKSVVKSYSISDNYHEYDSEQLKAKATELHEYYDIEIDSVEQIIEYKVTFVISYNGNIENYDQNVIVAKIDDEWFYIGS